MEVLKIMKQLLLAQTKYENTIENIKKQLKNKIDFDFEIIWQISDGFVLLDVLSSNVAPMESCLNIINKKGFIGIKDHEAIAI